MPLLILIALLVVVLIHMSMRYNRLVALRHEMQHSWADIETLLAQRQALLRELVEGCRRARTEPASLDGLLEVCAAAAMARESHDMVRLGEAETRLRACLAELRRDIGLDSPEIDRLDATLAEQAEGYNQLVALHNLRIEQFPDVLVAHLFAFSPAQAWRFATGARPAALLEQSISSGR
ncbi:LemA family protein [Chitinimonas arctica]|uniref:LemA family protein n=1 Tax=Chitinimonas arctica TaxID=2594795 RepID=A0A516SIA9_9NEIS|nr:LemA family protein [Chitinimonas arctica]QDQ27876.1 LemA family protein [Chitinimonas arctica]